MDNNGNLVNRSRPIISDGEIGLINQNGESFEESFSSIDEISKNLSVLLKELQERRAGCLIPAEKFKSDKLVEKIEEEVEEVRQALKGNGNLIEEIVDVQLVCETFLSGLGLNQEQRNDARKNRRRSRRGPTSIKRQR